jgi:hypothetical protein
MKKDYNGVQSDNESDNFAPEMALQRMDGEKEGNDNRNE